MALEVLTAAIDELVAMDPRQLADAESIIGLHRQLDRLQAITTAATGRFDTTGDWIADGARTAAAWIARRCHRPKTAAQHEIALARSLRQLAHAEAAWRAGDISTAHVTALASLRRPATQDQLTRDEAILVEQAKTLPFHHFRRAAAYWAQLAAPDDDDRRAEDQHDQRRVKVSQSFDWNVVRRLRLGHHWRGDLHRRADPH